MKYRPEIDGLRAVAVIPVILFHAGLEAFSGGYVGVDVFFVISGYLITSIILSDLSRGRFSLSSFYERRARRILPALTVVVLACFPIAWLCMLPDDLENFGQSAFATMLSLNNVLLALTSGYWDLASEFKPLVHTWSLGVEEQFYIIFPLLLMLSFPILKMKTAAVVLVISFVSFLAATIFVEPYPTSTFFLLHTRAWELGIGALGAFIECNKKVRESNIASFFGLFMIIFAIFFFDDGTPYPSQYTLIPTSGTLLIIVFARRDMFVARILSARFLVGVGIVSYSAYLWHQPLFAFSRIISFEEPSIFMFAALIFICFVLAFLTWKFVEQPFRKKSIISTRMLAVFSFVAILSLSAFGAAFHFGQGIPSRIFHGSTEISAGMHINYNARVHEYSKPAFDRQSAGVKILVIGNSQARDFANILLETGILDDDLLIYRSELPLCEYPSLSQSDVFLVEQADVIFFPIISLSDDCRRIIQLGFAERLNIVFVGPKHFGYNLNAYIGIPDDERPYATAEVFDNILVDNRRNIGIIGKNRYIDLIGAASRDGRNIRIFDNKGNLISADRVHITMAGARFFGKLIEGHASLLGLR